MELTLFDSESEHFSKHGLTVTVTLEYFTVDKPMHTTTFLQNKKN